MGSYTSQALSTYFMQQTCKGDWNGARSGMKRIRLKMWCKVMKVSGRQSNQGNSNLDLSTRQKCTFGLPSQVVGLLRLWSLKEFWLQQVIAWLWRQLWLCLFIESFPKLIHFQQDNNSKHTSNYTRNFLLGGLLRTTLTLTPLNKWQILEGLNKWHQSFLDQYVSCCIGSNFLPIPSGTMFMSNAQTTPPLKLWIHGVNSNVNKHKENNAAAVCVWCQYSIAC